MKKEEDLKMYDLGVVPEFGENQLVISQTMIASNINTVVKLCYGLSKRSGWHDKPVEFGTRIALIHSEVSEALEGHRKGLKDDHLKHRDMAEVELADVIIRVCDLAGEMGYDLGGALIEKLIYNQERPDHKKENREKEGGKKY